jgi:hypothetical protein
VKTVIGLYPSKQDVIEPCKRIEEAGFTKDSLSVITQGNTIKCLLGCKPAQIITRYASWGATLGIAIYGIFVLVAVWCDCIIYPISQLIAFEIVIGGIAAGAFFGGFLGVFVGWAEYENDTHLYTQGINLGDQVIVLRTEVEHTEKAMETLRQVGCLGVRMLPSGN